MNARIDTSATGVSVLVFTLDEEQNIIHCLESLSWCDDVVVVDSFSNDATVEICKHRKVAVFQHAFEGFGRQRNWALDNVPLKHDWVLILDADERVPEALSNELLAIAAASPGNVGAYRLRRRFYMWGRWLRYSSLYPTWVVRFVHRSRIRYMNRGHAETQDVRGAIGELEGYLIDENHKGIDAWFERQNRYASQEATYELDNERGRSTLSELIDADPMRRRAALKRLAARIPCRGLIYFLYCYVFRLGFLDGRDGLVFCRMKALYQTMITIKKHDLGRRER